MSGSDNPFHDFIPLTVILLLWSIVLIFVFIFYKISLNINEVWAKSFSIGNIHGTDRQYIYIFRLIFETPPLGEELTDYGIHVILWDEDNSKMLLNILVGDNRLKCYQAYSPEEPHKSIVRFLVHTNLCLKNMSSIVLNMTSNHWLRIFNFEIQDFQDPESEAHVAQVGITIRRLKPTKAANEQSFPIMAKRFREIEGTVTSTRILNPYEYILFIWMTINLISMFATVLKICHKSPHIPCRDYNFNLISTFYTGLVASLCATVIFVIVISIYRYLIKYNLEKSFDSILWQTIRYLYVFFITFFSIGSALIPIVTVADHKDIDDDPGHAADTDLNIFWILSVMIGVILYIFIWLTILAIAANYLKFFTVTGDQIQEPISRTQLERQQNIILKKSPKKSPKTPTEVKQTPKKGEKVYLEEESDNYFKELMKANQKVASVSQYKGLAPPEEPPPKKETPPKKESPPKRESPSKKGTPGKSTKKTPEETQAMDEESDNYFKELMKVDKVKSISQYRGHAGEQPPKN